MGNGLSGKKIAFLVANSGVEQIELTTAWEAVQQAGGQPVLVAPEAGQVQAFHHDVEKADQFTVDSPLGQASVDDFAALVLPGGTTNPDKLRTVGAAVDFVKGFVTAGKPVAAICHGPWTLVEAGVVSGKRLTSWPSLRTDISNAGGSWADEEAVVSAENGWTLVTSRKPDDLEAFTKTLVEQFSQG